ncbi:MAG: YbhB/YbcL family Raf kinase inhibitor-like protein [Candidatus Competibacterales bacterium]
MLDTKTPAMAVLIGILLGTAGCATTSASATDGPESLTLTSSTIGEGRVLDLAQVFQGFGCEGGNTAPDLSWSGAPIGTKSFAVTVYDPDAPTGSGWWHWFAFNIPADVTALPTGGTLPEQATTLVNDYGTVGFGGACPPPGEVHRYQFTVHALGAVLDIDGSVSNALAGYMVNANSLASDTITAVYTR